MKAILAALCLIPAFALAQTPQPPVPPQPQPRLQRMPANPESVQAEKVLPENLQLKLVVTEKEQQIAELSCVTAVTQFEVSSGDPMITLAGTITPEEGGSILIHCALGSSIKVSEGNNTSYVGASYKSSVRLKLGEPVQIAKLGTRTYQLTVSRLAEPAKKGK